MSSRNLTGEDCEFGAMRYLVLNLDSLIPQFLKLEHLDLGKG